MAIRLALFALVLGMLMPHAPAHAGGNFSFVQFRDLFRGGKPSPNAQDLDGSHVGLVGFFAPPPTDDSPFLVMVGNPTSVCPYCTTVSEEEHLPFVLVYPQVPFDWSYYGQRRRYRVVGKLSAGGQNENFYQIHNDLRIVDAVVVPDQRTSNPTLERLKAKRRKAAAPVVSMEEDD